MTNVNLVQAGEISNHPFSQARLFTVISKKKRTFGDAWTACRDGSIIIRDSRGGQPLVQIETKGTFVRCFKPVEATQEMWVGYSDGWARVYQANEPYPFLELVGSGANVGGVNAMAESLHRIFIGYGDNHIGMFDLYSYQLLGRLSGHSKSVRCLAVWNDSFLISGSDDATVRFWDITDPANVKPQETDAFELHNKGIWALEVTTSELGDMLWSGSEDGKVKVYDLRKERVLRSFTVSSPVTSLQQIDEVMFVVSWNSQVKQLSIPLLKELSSTLPFHSSFNIHSSSVAKKASSSASIVRSIAKISELSEYHLCVTNGHELTRLVQESFEKRDPELIEARRSHALEEELVELNQLILSHQERLQLRVDPPEDEELFHALENSREVQARVHHSIKTHSAMVSNRDEQNLMRKFLMSWQIATIINKSGRLRNRSLHLKMWIDQQRSMRFFIYWKEWYFLRQSLKAKMKLAAYLETKNNEEVYANYWIQWAKFTADFVIREKLRSVKRLTSTSISIRALRKWKLWLRVVRHRRRQEMVLQCFRRSLSNGLMFIYFYKMKKYVNFARKRRTRQAFGSILGSQISNGVQNIYLSKWRRFAALSKSRRATNTAKALLLQGNSSFVRYHRFQQWKKFLAWKKHARMMRTTTQVFQRTICSALLRCYYVRWRHRAVLTLAITGRASLTLDDGEEEKGTKNAKNAQYFLSVLHKDGLQRRYWMKWEQYSTKKRKNKFRMKSLEMVMVSHSVGIRRLYWKKWRGFVAWCFRRKKRDDVNTVFARNFSTGLRRAFWQKWYQLHLLIAKQKQRKSVLKIFGRYHSTVLLSNFFQKWLLLIVTKRRIKFAIHNCGSCQVVDLREKYYFRWLLFAAKIRRAQYRKTAHQIVLRRRQFDSLDVTNRELQHELARTRGLCQEKMVRQITAEELLDNVRASTNKLKSDIDDKEKKNTKLATSLQANCEKLQSKLTLLGNYKNPVEFVSECLSELKALEGRVQSQRTDVRCSKAVSSREEKEWLQTTSDTAKELKEKIQLFLS